MTLQKVTTNNGAIVVYPFGTSLMESTIETCPIEVFRPECTYYLSLNEDISDYSEIVQRLEGKLVLLSNVDDFVNEHFNDEYERSEERIMSEIEELEGMPDGEDLIQEKERVLEHLPEIVESRLQRRYYKENHICPEMKDGIEQQIMNYTEMIRNLENDLIEWKQYCLDKAKDEENKLIEQSLKTPHSKEDVTIHILQFVKEKVGSEFSELYSYYVDLITDVINGLTGVNKYVSTIHSVISERGTTNFFRIFDSHNDYIKHQLSTLAQYMINHMKIDDESHYDAAEQLLKTSYDEFLTKHYMNLASILREKITSTDMENGISRLRTACSVEVKNITREFVSKVTKLLKEEIELMIKRAFEDYFTSLQEKMGYRKAIVNANVHININEGVNGSDTLNSSGDRMNSQPLVYERSDNNEEEEFIDYIESDRKYSISELTQLYNEYHNTTLSTVSVGKLSYIRQHFEKRREANAKTHKQEYMYWLK